MFDPSRYTIGWVCVLPTELLAAKLHLDERHDSSEYESEPNDDNTYIFGSIGKHDVVIATLPREEYGISSATSVARDLIRSFTNVRVGLMVGIGGGAPLMEQDEKKKQDIRLGDVVVSVPGNGFGGVHQYDYGKDIQDQPFLLNGHLNSPSKSILGAVTVLGTDFDENGHDIDGSVSAILANRPAKLRKQYERPDAMTDRLYKSTFFHSDIEETCSMICKDEDEVVKRAARDEDEMIVIHYGLIASANTLMKNAVVRNGLASQFGVLCFEMEAAGLMNLSPFLVVRGICDYSDTHKNKAWQGYAAMTAAAYAKRLLLRLAPSKVKGETKLSELNKHLQAMHLGINAIDSKIQQQTMRSLRKDVQQWLAAPDTASSHRTARALSKEGTGLWLLQSQEYCSWKASPNKNLWLHGKPGCGKTIIFSLIVQDMEVHCQNQSRHGLAIFYFTFSESNKQSYTNMLRSLVIQLSHNDAMSSKLTELYYESRDRQPSDVNLEEILLDVINDYDNFYLLIDALDEATEILGENNSVTRGKLLNKLVNWSQRSSKLQILATSRSLIDISDKMTQIQANPVCLDGASVNDDIKFYVSNELSEDPAFSSLSTGIKTEIEDTFSEKADGMFRWAALQLENLKSLPSQRPTRIRAVLGSLPIGLDATYERMLESIHPMVQNDAVALLKWIAFSKRPLTLRELSEACVIDPDVQMGIVDVSDVGSNRDALRILSGFVVLIKNVSDDDSSAKEVKEDMFDDPDDVMNNSDALETQKIRLAHFSVKEYLISDAISQGPTRRFHMRDSMVQQYLSRCCVVYLMHYADTETITKTEKDLTTFPLLEYAARFWYQHCQNTEDTSMEVRFLQSESARNCWILVHEPTDNWRQPFSHTSISKAAGLYYAAGIGLDTVANGLIDRGADVNAEGGQYGNALQAACYKVHESMIELLIEAGANINAQGGHYGTALQAITRVALRAAKRHRYLKPRYYGLFLDTREEKVIEMLLDAGADGPFSDTLHYAITCDKDKIVKMLIEAGVDANTKFEGHNALCSAVSRDNDKIVQMLLDAGADINAECLGHGSALWNAMIKKNEQIVKMLLKAGADPKKHGGALWNAILKRDERNTKLFLEAGADPDILGYGERAPIHHVLQMGNEPIIKMLLKAGASLDISDREGMTAMHYAIFSGNEQVVKMLLEAGANPNILDHEGKTPIHYAVRERIIKTLPEAGANFGIPDRAGRTLIHYAFICGKEQIIKILLEAGANPNIPDRAGRTLIHYAFLHGKEQIIKILLEVGANFDTPYPEGITAIHHAAKTGNIAIYDQLIATGKYDVNARDKHGKTVLDYICISGSAKMLKNHLKKDQDNGSGRSSSSIWSPMHWACRKGSFECLKLLSAANFRATIVETKEPPGFWTPLDIASYYKNLDLVTEDGEFEQRHDWQILTPSGVVGHHTNETSTGVIMVRKNSLHPAEVVWAGYCDGCLLVSNSTITLD